MAAEPEPQIPAEREPILRVIESWPREEQEALARKILRSQPRSETAQPQSPPWEDLLGILSNGQPPPTDEEVAEWLDERRMTKYG